jgi:translation elongation factor EF-Tu-like GTPase
LGEMKQIGLVTRYFHKIGVAAIKLEGTLTVGDSIRIKGATTDFEMEVASMQIDRKEIESGQKGQEIAIKVTGRVRENDSVSIIG